MIPQLRQNCQSFFIKLKNNFMFPKQINLMDIPNILGHYLNHIKTVSIIKVKFQQNKIMNYKKKVKYFMV